jgi:hypothetical protein
MHPSAVRLLQRWKNFRLSTSRDIGLPLSLGFWVSFIFHFSSVDNTSIWPDGRIIQYASRLVVKYFLFLVLPLKELLSVA